MGIDPKIFDLSIWWFICQKITFLKIFKRKSKKYLKVAFNMKSLPWPVDCHSATFSRWTTLIVHTSGSTMCARWKIDSKSFGEGWLHNWDAFHGSAVTGCLPAEKLFIYIQALVLRIGRDDSAERRWLRYNWILSVTVNARWLPGASNGVCFNLFSEQ